jgi:RNA polymerase sigma factor for flagellar operon FliA
MEAVDHFRPEECTRFSTYACLRIRGRVTDYLRTSDWMPRVARNRARLIQKSINALWSDNNREPTEEELAVHLDMTVDEIRLGLADSNRILISLDTMDTGRGEDGLLHDEIQDDNVENPADRMEDECLVQEISVALQHLSKREQLILSLYYNDGLTFREIGKVLDIHESRVCQLHARAILTLKAMMNEERNDE